MFHFYSFCPNNKLSLTYLHKFVNFSRFELELEISKVRPERKTKI